MIDNDDPTVQRALAMLDLALALKAPDAVEDLTGEPPHPELGAVLTVIVSGDETFENVGAAEIVWSGSASGDEAPATLLTGEGKPLLLIGEEDFQHGFEEYGGASGSCGSGSETCAPCSGRYESRPPVRFLRALDSLRLPLSALSHQQG